MITHLFNLRPPIDCIHAFSLNCNSKVNCNEKYEYKFISYHGEGGGSFMVSSWMANPTD